MRQSQPAEYAAALEDRDNDDLLRATLLLDRALVLNAELREALDRGPPQSSHS